MVNNNQENRMPIILDRLLSQHDIPESLNVFVEFMCQLYHFDRIRSFIRDGKSDFFVNHHEAAYGQVMMIHDGKNGVDLDKSYYQKKGENPESIIGYLHSEKYIHTYQFSEIEEQLQSIGYIPTEDHKVDEVCIKCISSNDGVIGYFVFERFDTNTRLTEEERLEVRLLCEVAGDRIIKFEFGKQLRDEEIQKEYDDLTGLSVLKKFKSDVLRLLEVKKNYAILCLDIDKFKYINEIWSRDTGNDILKSIARILKEFVREDECCCRIADDKFAVLLHCDNQEDLQSRLDRLNIKYAEMQQTQYEDIKIAIISGAYLIQDNINVNLMIDKANIARRSVKGTFENVVVIYNQNLENLSEREKQLENRMTYALEHGEFIPFLQPKFDLKTGTICGAEALARWQTAERMIPPVEFVPVFEKNGFITKLDFVIYEEIFRFIRESLDKGYDMKEISLNVSRGHIKNENFIKEFFELMGLYKIPRELIELEITESVFIEDDDILSKFIGDIREGGLRVSIDDFGTAYSSLNLLKNIDVDAIKMDKSFIDNLNENVNTDANYKAEKDKIIIKNVLTMIKELNFKTIFEGIETEEQVEFLRGIGCRYGQGFYFSRPLKLREFEERFLENTVNNM